MPARAQHGKGYVCVYVVSMYLHVCRNSLRMCSSSEIVCVVFASEERSSAHPCFSIKPKTCRWCLSLFYVALVDTRLPPPPLSPPRATRSRERKKERRAAMALLARGFLRCSPCFFPRCLLAKADRLLKRTYHTIRRRRSLTNRYTLSTACLPKHLMPDNMSSLTKSVPCLASRPSLPPSPPSHLFVSSQHFGKRSTAIKPFGRAPDEDADETATEKGEKKVLDAMTGSNKRGQDTGKEKAAATSTTNTGATATA